MKNIIRFFNRFANPKAFRLVMLLFFVSTFIIDNQWFGQQYLKQVTGLGMVDMNILSSSSSIYDHLNSLGTEGRDIYLTLLKLDFLLIITLGSFQIISILRLLKNVSLSLYSLILIPIARGMFDAAENVLLHISTVLYPSKNIVLLKITSVFIFTKWIIFWLTIGVLLILAAVNIYKIIKRRKKDMKESFKIIALTASANKNSLGKALTAEALKGAQSTGTVVETIDLYESNLHFCTGCLACMETGKCHLDDHFQEIKDKLYNADGFILCAPTYCGTYNAVMKNFIDRLGLYERFTSSLGNKYIASISTAGNLRAAKKTASQLSKVLAGGIFAISYVTGTLGASSRFEPENKSYQSTLEEAHKLGRQLAKAIRTHKRYPLQNILARLLSKVVLRPVYTNVIKKNKGKNTKGVYQNLAARNLI